LGKVAHTPFATDYLARGNNNACAQESTRLYNADKAADHQKFFGDIKTSEFNKPIGPGIKIVAWVGNGGHKPKGLQQGQKVR